MRKIQKIKESSYFPVVIILLVALLFITPNIIHHGMIMGSDVIFHFNRFYDTAMQIKTGNFQYFTSTFGFQQSGRIVNAFYGPLVAYFQGLLVLISGSWFRYQLLANFILYGISGTSMYVLLRKNRVRKSISLSMALVYMTTYAIHYWTIRQAFTSWGAALLPLCLLPICDMVEKQKIIRIQLAVLMALMFQTHVFSSLLLAIIYTPFFLYGFIVSKEKLRMVKDIAVAILLFFVLTGNIWISYLDLYGNNTILAPFINKKMFQSTINLNSRYWLMTPIILKIIMIIQLIIIVRFWPKISKVNKIAILTGVFFLVGSSSLIPWKFLTDQKIPLVQLIQFPFRFFVPYTVLLLFSCGLLFEKYSIKNRLKMVLLSIGVIVSIAQTLILINSALVPWQTKDISKFLSLHTNINSTDSQAVKDSFYDSDMSLSLKYWEKSTPDYLPITRETKENKYNKYEELIIEKNNQFVKSVRDDKLTIEWNGDSEKAVGVPVFKYRDTSLMLNGAELSDSDIQLSTIGTPTVKQKVGKNTLVLVYHSSLAFKVSLVVTITAWLSLLVYGIYQKIIVRRKEHCGTELLK